MLQQSLETMTSLLLEYEGIKPKHCVNDGIEYDFGEIRKRCGGRPAFNDLINVKSRSDCVIKLTRSIDRTLFWSEKCFNA